MLRRTLFASAATGVFVLVLPFVGGGGGPGPSGQPFELSRPGDTGSTEGVCIAFAITHGGIANEPYAFTRAAARWTGC